MAARRYSSALFAGILLIVLGTIFLFENIYTPFSAMRLIGRYWPLICIAVGVKRIFDYFLWIDPIVPSDPPKAKE
jgi:hypothetical protein